MDIAFAALILTAVAGLVWVLRGLQQALDGRSTMLLGEDLLQLENRLTALEERPEGPAVDLEPITDLLADFARRMDDYERDLEDGLDIARRRENRVRAAIGRALQRMEEEGVIDPALEAEVRELRRRDGAAGEEEAVPPVSEGVDWDAPSSVPGVTLGQLRQARMI